MPFNYNKVLVLGATSGIGWALASKLVKNGTSVIVTGRRQEKLDEFVSQHGKDKAEAVQFDITQLDKIPGFVKNIMESHPDIDSIFLNSGIQRGFDFSKPESIDLSSVSEEMNTNYISYIHLVTAFTPYLQKQSKQTSFIFTTSGLALVSSLMHRLFRDRAPVARTNGYYDGILRCGDRFDWNMTTIERGKKVVRCCMLIENRYP